MGIHTIDSMNHSLTKTPDITEKIIEKPPAAKAFVTKDFIESIPSDPHKGLMYLCTEFREWSNSIEDSRLDQADKRILFLEAYHLLRHYVADTVLEEFVDVPKLDEKASEVIKVTTFMYTESMAKVTPFVREREEQERLEAAETKVAQLLGKSFSYKLSRKDIDRINELTHELIESLGNLEFNSSGYQSRLIRRLHYLQSGLAETMASLESFYVLLSDAAVLYHKYHQAAEHPVKLIKQVVGFAWRSQVNAEELPTDSLLDFAIDSTTREDQAHS
jgi:hypothetical protein